MSLKERPTEYNFGFSFGSDFTCTKRPATTEVSPRFFSFHNDLEKIAYNEKRWFYIMKNCFLARRFSTGVIKNPCFIVLVSLNDNLCCYLPFFSSHANIVSLKIVVFNVYDTWCFIFHFVHTESIINRR